MTSAFAFFRRSDSEPVAAAPLWLYRSEAFVEDLDLMPAPQAVRRQAIQAAKTDRVRRPVPAGLRWSAAPTA